MTFPLPRLDEPLTGEFWRAAAQDRLAFPQCASCGRFCWYPEPCCPACGGTDLPWIEVRPAGRLFSWSVVHHAFLPAFAAHVPFVAAIAAIDSAPGVRLVSRLLGDDPAMDAPVRVEFGWLGFGEHKVRAPFLRRVS
ncbi:Zn-ribbon domain-containing OB-fold protein [Nonomuraea sp. 10N515B]|uniref:Zn-ribbon domain-containing OB-fold protein n=1 Tax=Nonomuraea sp. 10N515B TaxID=3457422 RepID=UPI003FCEC826